MGRVLFSQIECIYWRVTSKRKAQNMEKGIRMYLETWDCLNQKYCNTYIEEVKNNYHMMSIWGVTMIYRHERNQESNYEELNPILISIILQTILMYSRILQYCCTVLYIRLINIFYRMKTKRHNSLCLMTGHKEDLVWLMVVWSWWYVCFVYINLCLS